MVVKNINTVETNNKELQIDLWRLEHYLRDNTDTLTRWEIRYFEQEMARYKKILATRIKRNYNGSFK